MSNKRTPISMKIRIHHDGKSHLISVWIIIEKVEFG